ncbi:MFS transporter [Lactiplantibacillus pentosus]|jgi:MFS family permease
MKLIRSRDAIKIIVSQICSGVATWCITLGIQMIIIFKYNANIAGVSVLYAAALVPRIVLPSFIGSLLDKLGNRIYFVRGARIVAGFIATVCYFQKDSGALLFMVILLNSALSVEEPGMIGVIRNLPQKDHTQNFNLLGIYYMLEDIIKILGPAMAAGISFFLGITRLFSLAVILFLLSFVLLNVQTGKDINNVKGETSKKSIKLEVVKEIFRNKELGYVFVIVFTFLFALNAIDTSSGILIRTFTHKSYVQAVFVTLMGVGGTLGALSVLKLDKKYKLLNICLISMFCFGILISLVVFVKSLTSLLLIVTLAGILSPGIIMAAELKKQKLIDKEKASRLSGITVTVNSIAQLAGIALSPLIATKISVNGIFVFCGLLMILVALLGIVGHRRMAKN